MSETTVLGGPWRPLGEERYELGEGARYVDDRVLFVDLLAGRLLEVDPGTGDPPVERLSLDVPLGAVAPVVGGGLVAAAGTGVLTMADGGGSTWWGHPAAGGPVALRVNDACADPCGRFWFGSMAWDSSDGAGALHRLDLDGSVTTVVHGLTIPNGPAFSLDGRTMYLADTARSVILSFPLDPGSGDLGPPEPFVEVSGSPDGMTVDAEGFLWSAIWGSSCLHRYSPDGRLVEVLDLPASQPTSVALAPVPPYRAVVTTATQGLDSVADEDGRVLSAPVGVAGRPVAPFGPLLGTGGTDEPGPRPGDATS